MTFETVTYAIATAFTTTTIMTITITFNYPTTADAMKAVLDSSCRDTT